VAALEEPLSKSQNIHRHMYCNTSGRIQCEIMYEDSGGRDLNCLFCEVQVFKSVNKFIFFGQKYDDPVYVVII
jgi:hypothetical protein